MDSGTARSALAGSVDHFLDTDAEWRVAASGALMRAVATGQAIALGSNPPWIAQARSLYGRKLGILDIVLPVRAPPSCLSAAMAVLECLDMPAIAAIEIGDPLSDDPSIEGFRVVGDGRYVACEHRYARHALLPLRGDEETFLDSLGYRTRRNIRNFRRKAEAAGLAFALDLGPPPLAERAARHRLGAETPPAGRSAALIDRYDAFLAQRADAFTGRIRAPSGEIDAFIAGFVVDRSAYIAYQLHQRDDKSSLSLLMRSYLARALIEQGVDEIIFPNGCLGLLAAACVPQEIATVTFVRRSAFAAAKAIALATKAPAHPASEPLHHAWRQLGATGALARLRAIRSSRAT